MSLNDILGGFQGKAEEEAEELIKERFGEGAAGMVCQFFGKKSDDSSADGDSKSTKDDESGDDKSTSDDSSNDSSDNSDDSDNDK